MQPGYPFPSENNQSLFTVQCHVHACMHVCMHVTAFPRWSSISLNPEGWMLFCLGEWLDVTPSNPLPQPLAINSIYSSCSTSNKYNVCKHTSEFHAEVPVKYSSDGWFRLLAQLPLNSHTQWLPVSRVEIAECHWRRHPESCFGGTGNMQWSMNCFLCISWNILIG